MKYPLAEWLGDGQSGGSYTGHKPRGVLHTTETTSALPGYQNGATTPHFTVMPDGKVYQHLLTSVAARTLRNGPDPVQTNRHGGPNIQIEIVGRSNWKDWPKAQIDSVVALMWWCEAMLDVPFVYDAEYGGSEQYGVGNSTEFSIPEWENFTGWCAHQNVPDGNTHWDIGKFLPVIIIERMKEARVVSNLINEGAVKGVDPGFAASWKEMLDEGVFTVHTNPDQAPTAERLSAFFSRLLDEVDERIAAATVANAIAKGTKFTVEVV
jgi:hypothetical protein